MTSGYANGKICYLEIPALDVTASSLFYERVFGWRLRRNGHGSLAFEDTVGQVSGTWVVGRTPVAEAGTIVSIMVADARATCAEIAAAGGTIVRPVEPEAAEITAWFWDPAGNLFGIYEQRGLATTAPP